MSKLKECSHCKKQRVIYKNKTIDGERLKLCQQCTTIVERELKKEKSKAKREKKREQITEKKLDTLVSKVIRTLYGDSCCTCGSVGSYSTNHCGHCLSRRFRATRFNPLNLASQCVKCNIYGQGEQYQFGKFINTKHGEGTMELLIEIAKSNTKIGPVVRAEIYKIYSEALEHKNLKQLIEDYNKIFIEK